METLPSSGKTEAIVLIKAAPQVGLKHGETVCCAGIDLHGNWLRLYPVSFRQLDASQKFGRWDRIQFNWRLPNDDRRPESRRVDQQSLVIVGEIKKSERSRFLDKAIVNGLADERAKGRSLALLQPDILAFEINKKSDADIAAEHARFAEMRAQQDLFTNVVTPYQPCPYEFKYRYRTADGDRYGTCQDWEIEATFFNWSKRYGEERALADMARVFGEEFPKKGLLFAMGTHSRYPDQWLINGLIRLDRDRQQGLL